MFFRSDPFVILSNKAKRNYHVLTNNRLNFWPAWNIEIKNVVFASRESCT